MGTPKNQSVIKAFSMLKSFRQEDEWLTCSELSRRTNLPEASGYRLIQTLEQIGAVIRGPNGRYRTGMLIVSLSNNVAIGDLLRGASMPLLTELAYSLNITLHMGILEDGMVTYVAKVCTPSSLQCHTRLGAQLEAYCSGLGKVLLANMPADQLDGLISEGGLVALTPYTITDRIALAIELKKVRSLGYAVDDREISINMRCVAVPIRDSHGRTVAAISATDDANLMTETRQAIVRDALFELSASLENKVFPSGPTSWPRGANKRYGRADTITAAC